MTHEEHPNVKLVRDGYEAAFAGDMEWMDAHMADDIKYHVGGNSKWAGTYEGKATVLEYLGRQAEGGEAVIDIHDVVGGDDHAVGLGTVSVKAPDGSSAQWAWVEVYHIEDGKVTERWGMTDNDAAVDPFLDGLDG